MGPKVELLEIRFEIKIATSYFADMKRHGALRNAPYRHSKRIRPHGISMIASVGDGTLSYRRRAS